MRPKIVYKVYYKSNGIHLTSSDWESFEHAKKYYYKILDNKGTEQVKMFKEITFYYEIREGDVEED